MGPPNDCRFINESAESASIWWFALINRHPALMLLAIRIKQQLAPVQSANKEEFCYDGSTATPSVAGCWLPRPTANRRQNSPPGRERSADARPGSKCCSRAHVARSTRICAGASDAPSYSRRWPWRGDGGDRESCGQLKSCADYHQATEVLGYSGMARRFPTAAVGEAGVTAATRPSTLVWDV